MSQEEKRREEGDQRRRNSSVRVLAMDMSGLTFFVETIIGDSVVKETPQDLTTQTHTCIHGCIWRSQVV